MATTKLIPIRGNNGASILASISARNDYYTNPEKTNEKQYVSSYECNVDTASEEFVISKNLYANRTGRANTSGKGVLAYQIRQSFKPDEITPELANKIGYELALEFTKSKHQFIVATHIDKAHIHNHICFNSTNLDSDGKFNNYKNSAEVVRKISDRLCKENELSIVENPNIKGANYFEWQERKKGTSWKSFIKNTIDEILPNCKTFDEFLKLLQKQGFEVKQGKYIAFKPPNGERFSRGKTLGNAYTETALKERLGKAKSYAVLFEDDIGNLIKVDSCKGKGLENWANKQNLKTMAKSFNFLTENSNTSLGDLENQITEQLDKISNLGAEIKKIEQRQKDINDYQNHIRTYAKTKNIYAEYRKTKDKETFKENHYGEIVLHQNAKKFFDKLGVEKLAKLSDLQAEFKELNSEKKALYEQYYELKDSVKQYQTVQRNLEQILPQKQSKRSIGYDI